MAYRRRWNRNARAFLHRRGEAGAADAERDIRGFAPKFYTDEGNRDPVGNSTRKYATSSAGGPKTDLRASCVASFLHGNTFIRVVCVAEGPRLG
jgi:hypothetical protein